jgi:pimeloyl-ACP methyl ester carboxylesterase
MQRNEFLASLAAAAALPNAPAGPESSEYDLNTPNGSLSGTLTLPAPAAKKPSVVLIIAGSGPTDRNGDAGQVKTDTYLLLAGALASAGVASVRYDKRGVGASASALADESTLRFDDLVADAAAWIARLRADGRFGKIGIAGHSEGSLIGILAAGRATVDAFVSLEGLGRPAAAALRTQLKDALAGAPELKAASDRIMSALEQGTTVSDVPQQLYALYRPSVQPYLISWFRYDPSIEIAKLKTRVAIVQGTNDFQVPVDDAKLLSAARPAATLVVIPGMSHPLKDATGMTRDQQIATVYVNPALPIVPLVPATIAAAIT